MNVLDVQNLTLSFGENTLFSDLSFDIQIRKRSALSALTAQAKLHFLRLLQASIKLTAAIVLFLKMQGSAIWNSIPACKGSAIWKQFTCSTKYKTIWAELVSVYDDLIQMEIELDSINEKLKTNHSKELIDRQEYLNDEFTRNGGLTYKSMTRSALLGLGFSEDDFDKPTS